MLVIFVALVALVADVALVTFVANITHQCHLECNEATYPGHPGIEWLVKAYSA